jgi:hypothetical protein
MIIETRFIVIPISILDSLLAMTARELGPLFEFPHAMMA